MSIKAVSWALELFIPDMAAKLVLVALADCADGKTGECFPTVEFLSKAASASERTVQRKIALLAGWGLVERTENFNQGRQRANSYKLRLDQNGIAQDLAEGCHTVTLGEGDTPVTGEGDTPVTPEGDTVVTPHKEPSELTVINNLAAAPLVRVSFHDLVEEFTPRSDGDAIDPARGPFKALSPEDQIRATDGARAYCRAASAGGKPVPYLAVYLKERRWESIPAPGKTYPVEFVPEGSPRWREIAASGKSESLMRQSLVCRDGRQVYAHTVRTA